MAKKRVERQDAPPVPNSFKPWMLNSLQVLDEVTEHVLHEAERWLPHGDDVETAEYVDQLFDQLHKIRRRIRDAKTATNKLPGHE